MLWRRPAAPWSWAAASKVTQSRGCSGTRRAGTCPGAGRWWQGGGVPSLQQGSDGADGELVTHRHEVDRENTLHLYAVTSADAGTYVCTAQSQLGTAAATARLRVEGQ